jgi:hypothetical protein
MTKVRTERSSAKSAARGGRPIPRFIAKTTSELVNSRVRPHVGNSIKGVTMKIALALRRLGLSSDVLHSLGFGSMAVAISLWGRSASVDDWKAKARAERLAIFVGLWPPTFFLLGKVMQDLEASPAQQVLRARGVEESQLDDALRHEAAAVSTPS